METELTKKRNKMATPPIKWPSDPSSGDIYTSSNGDSWRYDECAWINICTPVLDCNVRDSGVTVYMTFNNQVPEDFPITSPFLFNFPFTYAGNNEWGYSAMSAPIDGYLEIVYINDSSMSININVPSFTQLASLENGIPVGDWQSFAEGEFSSICGLSAAVCLQGVFEGNFVSFSVAPISYTIGGEIIGYGSLAAPVFIFKNEIDNRWEIRIYQDTGQNATNVGYLPSVGLDELPIGDWIIPGDFTANTSRC